MDTKIQLVTTFWSLARKFGFRLQCQNQNEFLEIAIKCCRVRPPCLFLPIADGATWLCFDWAAFVDAEVVLK